MNMFINDDWVNVKLDTYGDSRNNYNLVSNPFGSQADARQTDAIDEFESYDINYNIEFETAGKIVNDGYNVEFKIPFKNLNNFTNKKIKNGSLDFLEELTVMVMKLNLLVQNMIEIILVMYVKQLI